MRARKYRSGDLPLCSGEQKRKSISRRSVHKDQIVHKLAPPSIIDTEIRELKEMIILMSEKPDSIISERDMTALMALSARSLKEFLDDEPEDYSISDLKSVY